MPAHSCQDSQNHALERVSRTAHELDHNYCPCETVFYTTAGRGTGDRYVEEEICHRDPHTLPSLCGRWLFEVVLWTEAQVTRS